MSVKEMEDVGERSSVVPKIYVTNRYPAPTLVSLTFDSFEGAISYIIVITSFPPGPSREWSLSSSTAMCRSYATEGDKDGVVPVLGTSEVIHNTSLLLNPTRPSSAECANWDLFKKEGVFYWRVMHNVEVYLEKSTPSPCLGSAMRNALSTYCLRVGVFNCPSEGCRLRKGALNDALSKSESDWSQLREWIVTVVACYEAWDIKAREGEGLFSMCQRLFVSVMERLYDPGSFVDGMCLNMRTLSDMFTWANRLMFGGGLALKIQKPLARSKRLFIPESFLILESARKANICPNRLWNVLSVSPRGHMDAMALLEPVSQRGPPVDSENDHGGCTEQHCIFTDVNSSAIQQLHKCTGERQDDDTVFPLGTIDKAFLQNGANDTFIRTAWQIKEHGEEPSLLEAGKGYVAISHVWSDGTGNGLDKGPGRVNSCLFDFFARIAGKLGCDGIWWDVICLPRSREARDRALNGMLKNYSEAEYTVVHDNQLLNTEWSEDGIPAVMLILSAWFTRGWTAAELFSSRSIKVLFKDAHNPEGDPVIKDLFDDILAREPSAVWPPRLDLQYPSLKHFIASDIIRRCHIGRVYERESLSRVPEKPTGSSRRVSTFEDLMAILRPRSTSWPRDRMTVAGLMATETFDSTKTSPEATKAILQTLARIRHVDLYHVETPLCSSGPWSWCPPSLFDLGRPPVPMENHTSNGSAAIYPDGVIVGSFHARILQRQEIPLIVPLSAHPALSARIFDTLATLWESCLLLRCTRDPCPLYLLVVTVGAGEYGVSCRYVGCVYFMANSEGTSRMMLVDGCECSLGDDVVGGIRLPAKNAAAMVDLYLDLAGFQPRGRSPSILGLED